MSEPLRFVMNSRYDHQLLLTTCWCETHALLVRREDLLAGWTYPCKSYKCREIAREKGFYAKN